MKRVKGLSALVIMVSIFILIFPVYTCYSSLVETNLFSSDLSYEAPDQDGLSANSQSEFRGFAPNVPPVFFFPVNNLVKWLLDFSYYTISATQRPVVLRC